MSLHVSAGTGTKSSSASLNYLCFLFAAPKKWTEQTWDTKEDQAGCIRAADLWIARQLALAKEVDGVHDHDYAHENGSNKAPVQAISGSQPGASS